MTDDFLNAKSNASLPFLILCNFSLYSSLKFSLLDFYDTTQSWFSSTLSETSWIKIARLRNINILKYADHTTLKAERKEKLKEPLDESERGE